MNMTKKTRHSAHTKRIEQALLRAGTAARRIARMYGTPIYVWENGKVVAKKP
jgi:hypothetical protein